MKKQVYLISNAHIDPIWQWTLDEGIAASLSTFASACNLLDTHDFVFCHNESMLYEWIEKNSPELFARIKKHVQAGKWQIMGGWYLQPDCNLARGESYVRQIAEGRKYFQEKFGVCPHVAVNVDSFGHSRGLVQILKKSGFDGYLCARPCACELELPSDRFVWVGLDGSEVRVVRVSSYNNHLGKVDEKIADEEQKQAQEDNVLILWGVGNHGGGPSAADLEKIAALQAVGKNEYIHSTPDAYFAAFPQNAEKFEKSLNVCMPGCYVSQSKLKRAFRTAENLYYQTERMCAVAEQCGLHEKETLRSVSKKIMVGMFHDALPGSSIKDAENQTVEMLGGAVSELHSLRVKAMLRLASGLEPTRPATYTLLAYNPFPYPVEGTFECEFMLADQEFREVYYDMQVEENGKKIDSQVIKERSNIPIQWRKRVAFHAKLEPFTAHKFDCTERILASAPAVKSGNVPMEWNNGRLHVRFGKNGSLQSLRLHGKEYLHGPVTLSAYSDRDDSWGMTPDCLLGLGEHEGDFERMDSNACAAWTAGQSKGAPVRIIEDGDVLTRLETLLSYGQSAAVLTWTLYKRDDYVDLHVRLYNNEKNKLLKLRIPAVGNRCVRQIPFGYEALTDGGAENAMLGYCAATGENGSLVVCNDGVFSVSRENDELAISLLRSVPYTAHPVADRKVLRDDRFAPRMDQGEHEYKFRFIPDCDLRYASYRAQEFAEPPYLLNMSVPENSGEKPTPPFTLSDGGVVVAAMRAEGDGYLVRLANECSAEQVQTIYVGKTGTELHFGPFEVKTLRIGKTVCECEQMEW